jgi:hypothetical protein
MPRRTMDNVRADDLLLQISIQDEYGAADEGGNLFEKFAAA